MLQELNHSLLLHKELSSAAERIARKVQQVGLGLPYVDGLAGLVIICVNNLNIAVSKSQSLDATPEVQSADERRDKRYKALRTFIEYQMLSDDVTIEASASYLLSILKKHGLSLWALDLKEQSARLKALFNNIDSDENARMAYQHIGATPDYESLKAAQSHFEEVYYPHARQTFLKYDPKVNETRKKLSDNLKAMMMNLQVAERINEDEDIKKQLNLLEDELNTIISATMSVARKRISNERSGYDINI